MTSVHRSLIPLASYPTQGMPIPPPSGKVRMEHVVPISSKYGGLTMERLRSLFYLGPSPDAAPHPTSTQGPTSKHKAAPEAAAAARNPACGEQGTTEATTLTTHEGVQGSAAVQCVTAAAPEVGSQGQGHHGCVQDKGRGGHSCQPPLQPASHIMLAIADDDGSVSLMRLFSHIQPPFEGPEVLPDAMAGGEGVQDSDEDS
eukprot:scaffold227718_cov21-Tisochrysis_lutea.AAC.1